MKDKLSTFWSILNASLPDRDLLRRIQHYEVVGVANNPEVHSKSEKRAMLT